mmetsp:Transcript_67267/g.132684  ORF Transcript_67267/g.132684 Transcript_67267/m.132684 type:complete len:103 (-) Transcript_67267:1359-1667(-)
MTFHIRCQPSSPDWSPRCSFDQRFCRAQPAALLSSTTDAVVSELSTCPLRHKEAPVTAWPSVNNEPAKAGGSTLCRSSELKLSRVQSTGTSDCDFESPAWQY